VTVVAAVAIPVLAMGIPIADTVVAIVRRRRRGISVAQADLGHLHHRLLVSGFSQREICALIYSFSAILGAISLAVIGHRKILGVTVLLLAGVVTVLVVNRLRASNRPVTIPEIISLFAETPAPASEDEPREAAL
jgi:UDP-GlcNAc:undecaprenyl-phosphate/decaprenyl-phosphate GlcNAc-1-phosphate transferase